MWSLISKKQTNKVNRNYDDESQLLLVISRKSLVLEELLQQEFEYENTICCSYTVYNPKELTVTKIQKYWLPIFEYFFVERIIQTIGIENFDYFNEDEGFLKLFI